MRERQRKYAARHIRSIASVSHSRTPVHRKSKTMDVHIGNIIKEELLRQGRSASWLAHVLYCDRSNVYKLFKKKSLDSDLLLRISEALQTDFFRCYSASLTGRGIGCTGLPEAAGNEAVAGGGIARMC